MFGQKFGTGVDIVDSLLDILLLRQGMRHFSGGDKQQSADKGDSSASATATSDSSLPKGFITEAFTQIDESYWRYIMSLLSTEAHATITKIVRALRALDDANTDGRNDRVSAFRIGHLLMPNKSYPKTVTGPAPGAAAQQPGQKGGGAKITTTTVVDTRFTEADSRVVALTRLHEVFEDLTGNGMSEKKAINRIIADLDAEGFLSKESVLKKFFEEGKEAAEKIATETFLALVHHRLSWTETSQSGVIVKIDRYEEIIRRHSIAKGKEMDHIDLFLDAIDTRVHQQQQVLERERATFLPEWAPRLLKIGLGILVVLIIISNLV